MSSTPEFKNYFGLMLACSLNLFNLSLVFLFVSQINLISWTNSYNAYSIRRIMIGKVLEGSIGRGVAK